MGGASVGRAGGNLRHGGVLRHLAGHAPVPVSLNLHGYVSDSPQRAADEWFPSFAEVMTRLGRERGWPPLDRAQYDQSIALRGAADGQVRLAFEVRDTGIGIAPEVQAGIFEVFSQADSSTVRKYGGAGLGLSIIKRVVDIHGGTLSLSNRVGGGLDAVITLPGGTGHA